jgi:hypothetical protein
LLRGDTAVVDHSSDVIGLAPGIDDGPLSGLIAPEEGTVLLKWRDGKYAEFEHGR